MSEGLETIWLGAAVAVALVKMDGLCAKRAEVVASGEIKLETNRLELSRRTSDKQSVLTGDK